MQEQTRCHRRALAHHVRVHERLRVTRVRSLTTSGCTSSSECHTRASTHTPRQGARAAQSVTRVHSHTTSGCTSSSECHTRALTHHVRVNEQLRVSHACAHTPRQDERAAQTVTRVHSHATSGCTSSSECHTRALTHHVMVSKQPPR